MITVADLQAIAGSRSRSSMLGNIAEAFNRYAPEYGVTGQEEIALCLAHICVETGGFRQLEENMNYSAKRLMQVWPSRFKTLAVAKQYERNPQKLANYVYGSRMGNKGKPNAGWLYRGSGPGQITGYDNFLRIQLETGIPVASDPDLLRSPDMGMKATLVLWQKWGMNHYANTNQITNSRKRWNGGTHGLAEVKAAYARGMKRNLSVPDPEPLMASLPSVPDPVHDILDDQDKGFTESTSNIATIASAGAGAAGTAGSLFGFIESPWVQALLIIVVAGGGFWLLRERSRKAQAARRVKDLL